MTLPHHDPARPASSMADATNLTCGPIGVLADTAHGAVRLLHWGRPVTGDAAETVVALERPVAHAELDTVAPITLVPSHADGFYGRPGIAGVREGRDAWTPRFKTVDAAIDEHSLRVTGVDAHAELRIDTHVRLDPATGALHVGASLHNDGDSAYQLHGLLFTFPVDAGATDVLQFSGRWSGEFREQRRTWTSGSLSSENRRGRTSHDRVPLVFVGTPGFGQTRGEVWGVHLAWSGNSVVHLEEVADGRRVMQIGELLLPGEVSLEPGECYTAPEVIATYSSAGTNEASQTYHRVARSREVMPDGPRPVIVNTWEAVYFDLDIDTLRRLADRAAAIGAERLVLDDGWFHGRRDDTAGLGDWWPDPKIFPDGLGPLIAYVRGLGLEFGIWVEPEMVNPDSDLYRAHPDWVLGGPSPALGRNQLVLDLANGEAFAHILEALDTLLAENDIAYVKWDMNRDHAQPTSGARPGSRRQTLALYALLAELRRRHPHVTFESCASGGGRIDLGILQYAARVWASDCNDPHERQRIQRGASHLIPLEVIGAHVGAPRSHTTRRYHDLGFRIVTALFGHFGVEWDLLALDEGELADVTAAVALYKRLRPLLHSGVHHRIDHPWPELLAQVVVAVDRSAAVAQVAQLDMAQAAAAPPLRIPGLDPERTYRIREIPVAPTRFVAGRKEPAWVRDSVLLTGSQLQVIGLQLPVLDPDTAMLLDIQALRTDGPTANVGHAKAAS